MYESEPAQLNPIKECVEFRQIRFKVQFNDLFNSISKVQYLYASQKIIGKYTAYILGN